MVDSLVTVQRSLMIQVPAGQFWTLLSGPQAWSMRPDRFAFDVTVGSDTRLRVVLGVSGTRPFVRTYELEDAPPGLAMSTRVGPRAGAVQVISFSAAAAGDATTATVAVRYPGPSDAGRDRWEHLFTEWLRGMREVAEGRAPKPGSGMPESLRVRCTPGAPLRKPVAVSASALIAAPPAAVWDVVYAPESYMRTDADIAAAGVVPGTPSRQAGELQYFVRKNADGWHTTEVIAVTELNPGRSALTANITSSNDEIYHLITPQAPGTRLELTHRWPGNIPGSKSKASRRAAADALQRNVNGYRDLIENHGS